MNCRNFRKTSRIFLNNSKFKLIIGTIESRFRNALEYEIFTAKVDSGNQAFHERIWYTMVSTFTNTDNLLMATLKKRGNTFSQRLIKN